MEQSIIEKMESYGQAKVTMLQETPIKYWLRAILAGMYLTIVGLVYWSLLHNMSDPAVGKVLGSLFFGVGLTVIVFTNSELFTSNNMYLSISSFHHKTSWRQTAYVWSICYLGNLIGAIIIALLLVGAGVLDYLPVDHALYKAALSKARQPASVLFFKGIFANWIVCLAVWVAFKLQEEIAKLFAMILIVFIFLYLGFEHSIANMGTFAMSLLGHGELTLQEALYNLVFCTPGNIVGGALFIGTVYCFLNVPKQEQTKTETKKIQSHTS